MSDYEPSPEETRLREQIKKLEAYVFGWRLLALICIGVWIISECQTKISYEFDPYNNLVIMRKSQWFRGKKTISVSWRNDSEGEPGWCAQDKNGRWYRVINEAADE